MKKTMQNTLRTAITRLRHPGRRKTLFAALVVCALLSLAVSAVFAMGSAKKDTSGQRTPTISVRGDKAVTGSFPVFFHGLGTVTPSNTVTVRSRVDGQLMRLRFTEGQDVKAGDLLAEIDPRPFKAELAQAEGQLARDKALLLNARQDLKRYKILLPQDSATPQQVDAAQASVRQYEAAVKADTGRVDAAKLQLTYSRVTAPISGRLGLRLVDEGNMVRSSDTAGIVVITEVKPISVMFTITESQLPRVLEYRRRTGEDAPRMTVEAWDKSGTIHLATGTLATMDNRIDTATGTVKMKATFTNEDESLFPNQFVNTRILVTTLENVVLIPTQAVQHGPRGAFVYMEDNGIARQRPVQTGDGDDTLTVITKGVAPGDIVVTDGVDRLRDGIPLSVVLPDGNRSGTPVRTEGRPAGAVEKKATPQADTAKKNAGFGSGIVGAGKGNGGSFARKDASLAPSGSATPGTGAKPGSAPASPAASKSRGR